MSKAKTLAELVNNYIDQSIQVGAIGAALNARASDAQLRDRATHTGLDSAANVVLADGVTLQTAVVSLQQAVGTQSASAPTIDTAPTISDTTPDVNQTLTFTPGTVTNAGGRTSANTYRPNFPGITTTFLGAGVTTYVVPSFVSGLKMTVTQRATDTVNSLLFAERTSAETSAVGAVVPTNSVAPTITPTGSQAAPTTYSFASLGTWADDTAATVEYQWTLSDADITGETAATYTSNVSQAAGVVKGKVRKTTAQGSSVWVTSSNSSTVTGAPALTKVAAPAFPATVTVGTAAAITNSTWSGGTPDASRTTRIYVAEGTGGLTTPYATIIGATATYTPEADGNSFLLSATGLTTLVGKTVYCDQLVGFGGQNYTSDKSAGKVVQAPSATLAARTDYTNLQWTQNQQVTSLAPVAALYGTGGPYTRTISPALPAGMTWNQSTGTYSGTPTVTGQVTTYTVTVADGVGTPVSSTFTAQVVPASAIVPDAILDATSAFSTALGYVQCQLAAYNGGASPASYTLANISDTVGGGLAGSGVLADALTSSTSRFGKFDIVTAQYPSGRRVIRSAMSKNDPAWAGADAKRVDVVLSGATGIALGRTYWCAGETTVPTQTYNDTALYCNIVDLHGGGGGANDGGWGLKLNRLSGTNWRLMAQIFETSSSGITNFPLGDGTKPGGGNWIAPDVAFKWVVKATSHYTTGVASWQLWIDGVSVMTSTLGQGNPNNTYPAYLKMPVLYGGYPSIENSSLGVWILYTRKVLFKYDNGSVTEPDIRALLT